MAPLPAPSEFHKRRLLLLVAASVGGLATFMPWVNAPIIGSVSGTAGPDGWISLCIFGVIATLAFNGERTADMRDDAKLWAGLIAFVAAGIGIWKIVSFNMRMGDIPRDNPFAEGFAAATFIGVGLYMIVAAGVAVVWIAMQPRRR